MPTRTLVHEDDSFVTYEVKDDDGNIIGTDVEPASPPIDPKADAIAKVDALAAGKTKDALLAVLDVLP